MPSGKWPGESYEARIERLAGHDDLGLADESVGPRAVSEAAESSAGRGAGASDWPFAEPPPYPADDEALEVPDE